MDQHKTVLLVRQRGFDSHALLDGDQSAGFRGRAGVGSSGRIQACASDRFALR